MGKESHSLMGTANHILFIHIPKTAGTSFRIAAQEYFGKENTFFDYSPHDDNTSKLVRELIYTEKDLYKFYSTVSQGEHSFMSGHFPTARYAALYDTFNVVTFVREPVAQILSHYNHYKNLHGYEKDLRDFVKEVRFRDIQTKNLHQKDLAFYGFIGITEEYNTSIDLFNSIYGTKLEYKHINVKNEDSLHTEDIDKKTIDLIRRLNAKDIALYDTVCQQFEVRKTLYAKNQPFTYGFIQKITEDQISGMAFQRGNDEAVEIDIYAGDKYLETVLAKNLRPGQVRNNVPRKGFIGFDYIYQGDETLDGELYAFIKATGQKIV